MAVKFNGATIVLHQFYKLWLKIELLIVSRLVVMTNHLSCTEIKQSDPSTDSKLFTTSRTLCIRASVEAPGRHQTAALTPPIVI